MNGWPTENSQSVSQVKGAESCKCVYVYVCVCVCDSAVSMLTSDSPAVDIQAFLEKSSTSRNIQAATSVASPAGSPEESSLYWSCKTLSPIQSKSLLKKKYCNKVNGTAVTIILFNTIQYFNRICLEDILQIKVFHVSRINPRDMFGWI